MRFGGAAAARTQLISRKNGLVVRMDENCVNESGLRRKETARTECSFNFDSTCAPRPSGRAIQLTHDIR
jgi:hypothetical protein